MRGFDIPAGLPPGWKLLGVELVVIDKSDRLADRRPDDQRSQELCLAKDSRLSLREEA